MLSIIFEPLSKRIVMGHGVTSISSQFIYSRWKEWARVNPQFLPAFRVVGGDPVGGGIFVSSYFFLINGWRIRPFEGDHDLNISGNIAVDGGGTPVVRTLGQFQINISYTVPVQAQALATGGGMAPSVVEIRQEMDTNSVALRNIINSQNNALTKSDFIALT